MIELNTSINKFFDDVKGITKELFLKDGSLKMAMCFMLANDKIVHLPFPILDGNKDLIATSLKQATGHLKPSALVFASECWFIQRDSSSRDETKSKFTSGMRVSEQSDKIECLMLVCETRLISHTIAIPIVRNSGSKVSFGEEIQGNKVEGRFANLLSTPIDGYTKN